MSIPVKQLIPVLSALALLFLASASPARADLGASAQVTDIQISPGEYQYDITLKDIGTTNVGTFWFSWVPGQNFMPVSPTVDRPMALPSSSSPIPATP